MIREVLALAVVAKAAKISSMVDSCGSANRYDGVLVRYLGLVWLSFAEKHIYLATPWRSRAPRVSVDPIHFSSSPMGEKLLWVYRIANSFEKEFLSLFTTITRKVKTHS